MTRMIPVVPIGEDRTEHGEIESVIHFDPGLLHRRSYRSSSGHYRVDGVYTSYDRRWRWSENAYYLAPDEPVLIWFTAGKTASVAAECIDDALAQLNYERA